MSASTSAQSSIRTVTCRIPSQIPFRITFEDGVPATLGELKKRIPNGHLYHYSLLRTFDKDGMYRVPVFNDDQLIEFSDDQPVEFSLDPKTQGKLSTNFKFQLKFKYFVTSRTETDPLCADSSLEDSVLTLPAS